MPSNGRKRLFLAVPLDDTARAAVAGLVDEVRDGIPDGDTLRWVRHESLHLTLRFLGATDEDRIPALVAALEDLARNGRPFDVAIAGAGAFPAATRPRVLWLGIVEGHDELASLAGSFDAPLTANGWPSDDRPFRAHLTIARADGVRAGPAAAARLQEAAAQFETRFRADRVVLFESRSERGGARYLPVHESHFGAGGGRPER